MKTQLTLGILAITAGFSIPQISHACEAQDMRWARSSNNFYINGSVTCTLSDIAQVAKPEVLELVDPDSNTWILRSNLRLTEGARLNLHGSPVGGDVDQLRLASPGLLGDPIYIRAHWGFIDIRNTSITSWNESAGGPQLDDGDGRSYIHARSFLDGSTPRESYMDITNSDIGYLGYHSAEAYGLVWKVLGHQEGLYDQVKVGGNVRNNNIHHNYMGFYSYGAEGMDISNNNIHHNISYGIDPHDDSDYLNITGNHSHHNGRHGIICSRRCNNLLIADNKVNNNLHGIMLHRDVTDSIVENNIVYDNPDTGIVLFESHFNTVRNNEVYQNKNGIRLSLGSHHNLIENNTVRDNNRYGLYFFSGSDQPETTDGRPRFNTLKNNLVANHERAFKMTDADDNFFGSNVVEGKTNLTVYNSHNNQFFNNQYPDKLSAKVKNSDNNIFDLNQDITLSINSQAEVKFLNKDGRIFRPQEGTGTTRIGKHGSNINITFAEIGKKSNITALPLWITPMTGAVQIKGTNSSATRWSSQQDTATQLINYTVGQLTPGQSYQVLRNSTAIATIIADGNGSISFSDSAGTTTATKYKLN